MKKQLKISDKDKKLIAINTYLNLFLGDLEEVVDEDTGDIYLRESGDRYGKVLIEKKSSECRVEYSFWEEFSDLFSLQYGEVQSIITRWVEETYQLKGIYTIRLMSVWYSPAVNMPTN